MSLVIFDWESSSFIIPTQVYLVLYVGLAVHDFSKGKEKDGEQLNAQPVWFPLPSTTKATNQTERSLQEGKEDA